MNHSDQDTTIGTGGWALVALAGIVSFAVLRFILDHDLFPAAVFALAIALVVLLLLYRLAVTVNRYDDEEESARVRKIVPGSSPKEGGARVSGVEGAKAGSAMAVRVGAEPVSATPVPLRPSSVVTPLASVATAPLLEPLPIVAAKATAVTPPAAPKAESPKVEKPKAVAKPKPKPKGETKSWKEKPAAKAKAEKPAPEPVGLVRLTGPRNGKADDLKEIEGIGPALEKLVNSMGFYHFDQIAAWTEADVAMVDAEMKSFKGRITRDRWVAQAKIIVTDGLEAFWERAKTNNY